MKKFKNKTRGGYEARIYAYDGADNWPIHGAIKGNEGWQSYAWTKDGGGGTGDTHPFDLIPDVPEPLEFEINVGEFGEWPTTTEIEKDRRRFHGHKVRVRIEVVE